MKHISLKDLDSWRVKGVDFQLIDVRTAEEHEAFNIGGTLIPLEDVMKKWAFFNQNKPIVVYCKRGIRSQIAIQRLQMRLPSVQFYNLESGILPLLL